MSTEALVGAKEQETQTRGCQCTSFLRLLIKFGRLNLAVSDFST